jgi:hypothetical protein
MKSAMRWAAWRRSPHPRRNSGRPGPGRGPRPTGESARRSGRPPGGSRCRPRARRRSSGATGPGRGAQVHRGRHRHASMLRNCPLRSRSACTIAPIFCGRVSSPRKARPRWAPASCRHRTPRRGTAPRRRSRQHQTAKARPTHSQARRWVNRLEVIRGGEGSGRMSAEDGGQRHERNTQAAGVNLLQNVCMRKPPPGCAEGPARPRLIIAAPDPTDDDCLPPSPPPAAPGACC